MKSDHIQGHQPHFNKFIVKELKQYIFLDQKRIKPEKKTIETYLENPQISVKSYFLTLQSSKKNQENYK